MKPELRKSRRCGSCRYWSDKIAQAIGDSVEALCLSQQSPNRGRYTTARMFCESHEEGEPIDVAA